MTTKTMLIFGRLMRYRTRMRYSHIWLLLRTIVSVLLSAVVHWHIIFPPTHIFLFSMTSHAALHFFILSQLFLSLLLFLSSSRWFVDSWVVIHSLYVHAGRSRERASRWGEMVCGIISQSVPKNLTRIDINIRNTGALSP
jgi:hypothetical protein